jgi:hypothetical protein
MHRDLTDKEFFSCIATFTHNSFFFPVPWPPSRAVQLFIFTTALVSPSKSITILSPYTYESNSAHESVLPSLCFLLWRKQAHSETSVLRFWFLANTWKRRNHPDGLHLVALSHSCLGLNCRDRGFFILRMIPTGEWIPVHYTSTLESSALPSSPLTWYPKSNSVQPHADHD